MKIRTDFVTNSSSSSFCLMGIGSDFLSQLGSHDEIEEALDGTNLEMFSITGSEWYTYLGIDIHEMGEDETVAMFRKRVIEQLAKAFPELRLETKDVNIHVDGGFDG